MIATNFGPFASRITGTGSAFPDQRLTNLELTKKIDTTDEWIRERTGIQERRIAQAGSEADRNSSLGARAALAALEMAAKTASDIDLILYATCTPDTLIPSTACWLQKKIGATKAWALDVNAACSGFVFGLATADSFLRSGQFKTALVVGGDILTSMTNWEDRGSCILFGDGAGAAIVERTEATNPRRILSVHMGADGRHWELFHVQAGGSNMEVTAEVRAKKLDKMEMKGREMFKVAVRTLGDYAVQALESNGLALGDLDWLVPHQANLRIIEAVAKRLELPMEKVLINIDRYGNTSSATIPTALDEGVRKGLVKPGETVLLDAFGAGVTYGSILMRW
ncbi:MAG: ketoacyl-ACP synthase III [Oligoflexia bacterium]|nr:ketoacyl-ACP synthase III [Oligoflexia bacterium]